MMAVPSTRAAPRAAIHRLQPRPVVDSPIRLLPGLSGRAPGAAAHAGKGARGGAGPAGKSLWTASEARGFAPDRGLGKPDRPKNLDLDAPKMAVYDAGGPKRRRTPSTRPKQDSLLCIHPLFVTKPLRGVLAVVYHQATSESCEHRRLGRYSGTRHQYAGLAVVRLYTRFPFFLFFWRCALVVRFGDKISGSGSAARAPAPRLRPGSEPSAGLPRRAPDVADRSLRGARFGNRPSFGRRQGGAGRDRQARRPGKAGSGPQKHVRAAPAGARPRMRRNPPLWGILRPPPGTMDICRIRGHALPKWRKRSRSKPCTPATWRRS